MKLKLIKRVVEIIAQACIVGVQAFCAHIAAALACEISRFNKKEKVPKKKKSHASVNRKTASRQKRTKRVESRAKAA